MSVNPINQSSMLSAYIEQQSKKPQTPVLEEASLEQKTDSFKKESLEVKNNDTKSNNKKKKIAIIIASILGLCALVTAGLYFTGRLTPEQKYNRAMNDLIDEALDLIA